MSDRTQRIAAQIGRVIANQLTREALERALLEEPYDHLNESAYADHVEEDPTHPLHGKEAHLRELFKKHKDLRDHIATHDPSTHGVGDSREFGEYRDVKEQRINSLIDSLEEIHPHIPAGLNYCPRVMKDRRDIHEGMTLHSLIAEVLKRRVKADPQLGKKLEDQYPPTSYSTSIELASRRLSSVLRPSWPALDEVNYHDILAAVDRLIQSLK